MITPVGAVILAGGQASRMGGGDKGFLRLGSKRIVDIIIESLDVQLQRLALNVRFPTPDHVKLGLPLITDGPFPGRGPGSGILAAIDWAITQCHAAGTTTVEGHSVLTVPCDTPFIPRDLLARLVAVASADPKPGAAEIVCARSGGRVHPVVALWPLTERDTLAAALADGRLSITAYLRDRNAVFADFSAHPIDPFMNLNTPEDLSAARQLSFDADFG